MFSASDTRALKSRRVAGRVVQASMAAAVAGLALAAPVQAVDTNYYYKGAATGTWDDASSVWATPLSTSTPLATWLSSATSDAFFTTGAANINLATSITANDLNIAAGVSPTFTGSTLTLNTIFTGQGGSSKFLDQVASSGQLVITGTPYPTTKANMVTVTLGADTNMIDGGILITGGSVQLNLGNSALRFLVDPTHLGTGIFGPLSGSQFTSPTGFNGNDGQPSAIQSGPVILTTVSGAGGTAPTITIDGSGSQLGLGNIHTNDYVLPNNVALNPSNAANFYVALGAGSVADSGSVAAGPFPAYASLNFTGQISGNGNIIISNDFYSGGGKGFNIFSNPNNNYTGKTIINNNGQNYITFMVGATGAIPVTSDLVFGAKSVGAAIGATSISGKQIGAVDLNGFDTTVRTLSSDIASNLSVLGITSTNNHAADPNITSGSKTTTTLTIDSQGGMNNAFFQGNITDGGDFLTQDNVVGAATAAHPYVGTYQGAASNYLNPANGFTVALKLAASNAGVLTISGTNGSGGAFTNVSDLGYTGGTTVGGGALYVNGPLTAPSGSATSQVLVTTPNAGNVAIFGGAGTITPDIHVQSGATLAPGFSPVALTTGSGTDFSHAPSAYSVGVTPLTVHNLTMDGGSQFNFLINDGSSTAVAGAGYGTLAFSAGGTFTEDASVTAGNPLFVHPQGTFSGFANYKSATWSLAAFPAGSTLANIVLDTRAGYSPVPTSLLGGGTFSVTEAGTVLNLVFTPSPNVIALQYSGPAAGTWDSAMPANAVWTDLVHGAGSTFYSEPAGNSPNVLFVTPSSSTIVTIQPGGVSPSSVIFTNTGSTVSYTLGGGSINGATGVSLNGSGRVMFTAANAYTGGTFISSGGTIETQISGALGSGDLTIYNGTWNTTAADQSHTFNVQVLGSAIATPATTSTIQTGPLAGSPAGNLTITGNILGSGALTKTGVGTLTVNGTLSESGGLNVNAGKLVINGTAAYGGIVSVLAGAGIEYQTAPNATIGFQASANLAGTLTFDNPTNVTFSPGSYAAPGSIVLKANGSAIQGVGGQVGGTPVDISNTINLNPSNTPNFSVYIGMAGNGNRFWLHGPITGNGNVIFGAGPGQGGAAAIELFTPSTYTGPTNLETGGTAVLTLGVDNALPTTTVLTFGNSGQGSGAFDLNGHNQTLAGLQSDPAGGGFGSFEDTAGGGSVTVNGTTSGVFNALISGIFTVNVATQNNALLELSYNGSNKDGNGNVLSYGNIYGGVTNVTSGALRISNPLALSPFQNLILQGGVLEYHANGFMMASGNVYGLPVNPTGAFTNSLGSTPNLVNWVPGTAPIQVLGGNSGFSAYGSQPGIINLGGNPTTTVWDGSGSTIVWDSAFFSPTVLVLNQTTAEQPLDFQNGLDLSGADRTVSVNSTLPGTEATLSGVISNSTGTAGLIKTGAGTLILTASNTYNGTTTLNGGTLLVNNTAGSATGSGNVNMLGGTLGGSGTISGVVQDPLAAGWKIHPSETLTPTSATTLHVGGLTTSSNATLDFNLVTPGASSVSDRIAVSGNNGLTINGGALAFTNHATGLASLGYYKIMQYSGSIGGAGVASLLLPAVQNQVVYTLDTLHDTGFVDVHRGLLGDANDDGLVNFADFVVLSNHFGALNTGWGGADFNNDGITNFSDFVILSNNFGATIGGNEIASSGSPATSGVPEPASLMLLGAGAAGLLLRRRRM